MKKLALSLLVLPMMAFIASCSDDDNELPQVDINFSYENAVVSSNEVYVVQPDTFVIESINVTATRPNHVATCVGPVNYWLDGHALGSTFVAPFGISIPTESLSLGRHTLTVNMGIAEEGSSLGTAVSAITFNVVADASDIPVPAAGMQTSQTVAYHYN